MSWTSIPLKRIATLTAGGTPSVDEPTYWSDSDGGHAWSAISDMSSVDTVTTTARRISPDGLRSARIKLGEPGTILFSMYASLGHTAWLKVPAAWNQAILGLLPDPTTDARFLRYSLVSLRPHLLEQARSNTQANLNAEQVGSLSIPRPPLAEQRRIADFLDAETARTDRIIAIRQQQSTLGAQRFNQLVDGVVMGDADALAEIGYGKATPDWSVGKIARLFSVIPGFAFPSKDFIEAADGTRLLRGINVAPGRIDWESETVAWDLESSPVERRYHLRSNDLVIGMDRPWISGGVRIALIREIDLPSLLLQRVACIRSRRTSTTRYLRWVLGSSHFRSALEGETTGVSVPHVSGDQIGSFTYRLPSPDEQELLAALLQSQDDLRAIQAELVDRQLSVLAERRQALITAAVTGQIDVTTARGLSSSGGAAV